MATVSAPSSLASDATTGRRAGSGAAAHARGDEHHVGAFQQIDDALGVFERGLPPHRRVRARAQSVGNFRADRQLRRHRRRFERLRVGVQHAELDAASSHASSMRATALEPPPPTPKTRIFVSRRGFFFDHEFQSVECHGWFLLFISKLNPSGR